MSKCNLCLTGHQVMILIHASLIRIMVSALIPYYKILTKILQVIHEKEYNITMNKKVQKTLELNKIIDRLSTFAVSKQAKRMCYKLRPSNDVAEVTENMTLTDCAFARFKRNSGISFSGLKNVTEQVTRIHAGVMLESAELLDIASTLETAENVKIYSEETQTGKDALSAVFELIKPLPALSSEIRRCILSEDEFADDASATLKNIRRKIGGMDGAIHDELNRILSKGDNRSYLSNPNFTMRNGRFCLPVKAEYKSHFPGVTHDQSGSGNTLFIEPASVVKLNNDLQQLLLDEKKEIEKILADLTNLAFDVKDEILADERALTQLDFIFAKAKLASAMSAFMPHINSEGKIQLKQARHPLLDAKKAVPIDISLGFDYNLCVITGPNTGGKTVSLKTVGLLTLMAQSGLLIPASPGSDISIFDEVYADIGDEQSIEQSLSTFSSHMKNITWITDHVNDRCLVLFDELCAGTDPTEGAALATSILDYLLKKNVRCVATTHYAELKVYALSTEGVENACLEFDVETLSPTYRLLVGIPGKSNAFAISEKIGLNKALVDDARSRISSTEASFEDLYASLEESRITIEKEREEIAKLKDEARLLTLKLTTKQEKLDGNRDKILREANEEAAKILQEAKELADSTIRDFNKYGNIGNPDIKEMERKRTKVREALDDKREKSFAEKKTTPKGEAPKDLKIGDTVHVISMNLDGTVHSLPDSNGNLTVSMGILKSKVSIHDIAKIDDAPVERRKKATAGQTGKIMSDKAMYVSPEILLIGKTVDEALQELDKYLDDAYLSHLSSVRIVHGKGTGALRNAVHSHLKKLPYVASFGLGEYGEGDAGVTICNFK